MISTPFESLFKNQLIAHMKIDSRTTGNRTIFGDTPHLKLKQSTCFPSVLNEHVRAKLQVCCLIETVR